MADEDTKKKLKLRKLFKDVIERNIRECVDIVPSEVDLEKEIKVTSTIDIIKKKAAAVKKLEEEIVDITTDDSLLEEIVHEEMTLEIYCKEQLTILAKYSKKVEKKIHQKYEDKSRNVKLPEVEIKKRTLQLVLWRTNCVDDFHRFN